MTTRISQFFVACFFSLGFSSLPAQVVNSVVPESIPGVKTLTAESLIELAHSLDDLVVVDSRLSEDRSQGFIEDSYSLPDINTSCATLGGIGPDLNQPLVFYCNGVKCGRSVKAVQIAAQCDYKNLYWFKGGFEEWWIKDYPYLLE